MRILFAVKTAFAPPLGVMYLSSFLKKHGEHVTHIVDLSLGKIQIALREDCFDMLAFSCTDLDSFRESLAIAAAVKKEHAIFTAIGGAHVGFFDLDLTETAIDGHCVGEGEEALLEFAQKFDAGQFLGDIPNWIIKIDGTVYHNDVRRLVEDLDALPFPDRELCRDLIPYEKSGIFNKMNVHFVSVSRGCPYRCTYCFNSAYIKMYANKGPWYRRRQVASVIEELRILKEEYSPSMLVFVDDTFIRDIDWFREFATHYSARIGIPYFCQSRPDLITEEAAELLRRSGCKLVSMGIESGNDHVRNEIMNRNISKEQIVTAAQLIRKNKIHLCTLNVLGAPGADLASDIETIALNIECRPDTPVPYLFHPLPNTDLTNWAVQTGRFASDYVYAKNQFYGQGAQEVNLEKGEIKAFQMNNLYHFFPFLVKYPFLGKCTKILIRLPFAHLLYRFLSRWKRDDRLTSKFDFFIEQ